HTAVATLLPFAFYLRRRRPFDVQLAIAELLSRCDVSSSRDYLHVAVLHHPLRIVAIVGVSPFGKVLAVEKHDGIGRRIAAGVSRCNDRRFILRRRERSGLLRGTARGDRAKTTRDRKH